MWEMQVRSSHREDPLKKEMAIQSSIPCMGNPTDREAWRATIHGVTRVRHDLATKPPSPPIINLSFMVMCQKRKKYPPDYSKQTYHITFKIPARHL